MTFPKRWLSDGRAAASLEARVLAAGKDRAPPSGLEDRAWMDFMARVSSVAAAEGARTLLDGAESALRAPGAALGPAASSVTTIAALKAMGVGAVIGVITVTGVQVLTPQPARPSAAGVAATSVPSRPEAVGKGSTATSQRLTASAPPNEGATSASDRELQSRPLAQGAQRPSLVVRAPTQLAARNPPEMPKAGNPASPAAASAATAAATSAAFPLSTEANDMRSGAGSLPSASLGASQLRAEALELAQAKNLLQQGRASEAEALLRAGARRFSTGALNDERELLTIQALLRLGRSDEARGRALRFVSAHPGSPISARIRGLIGGE
jgi:hypothetical protein